MANKGKQTPTARTSAAAKGASPSAKRRPSPAVYRRRRQVFFGALLLVIVVVIGGVVALTGALSGNPEPQAVSTSQASTAPTPGSTPTGTAAASPSPTPVCDLNLMTVAAKTDKPAYGPEEKPLLTMTITNGGTAPCEVNVGTSQMEYLLMSGSDRIFSSKDCQTGGEDLIKTIQPGKSETANFPWQRNRTLEGCASIAATPGAGGAYYTFEARLGNKASPKVAFQLN
ncbi:hypothetical protein MOD31_11985 [Paenarthrobacter sp. TYUT067]|uniref:hypothetical protein n=1 Tax=Micrococcaceae TaxID=1268 RepID=UPI001CC53F5A|nr:MULTISPECIES: hypothetical protein [Micrococcaceae]MCM0616746.1 hypothetical protein [Paenarthrobacter sp. TYUT067]BCW61207.1 hypothetical protein StoSoilB22_01800 [Arthrobacter sp. StoSoilB22]